MSLEGDGSSEVWSRTRGGEGSKETLERLDNIYLLCQK